MPKKMQVKKENIIQSNFGLSTIRPIPTVPNNDIETKSKSSPEEAEKAIKTLAKHVNALTAYLSEVGIKLSEIMQYLEKNKKETPPEIADFLSRHREVLEGLNERKAQNRSYSHFADLASKMATPGSYS